MEKRALLDIERERASAARLQKQLDAAVRRAEQHDARHRAEAERLRGQLGDARHQAGLLQGRLDALEATSATYVRELDALRAKLSAKSVSTEASARSGVPRGAGATRKSVAPIRKRGAPKRAT
jgi:chromosome segregation ATPase